MHEAKESTVVNGYVGDGWVMLVSKVFDNFGGVGG